MVRKLMASPQIFVFTVLGILVFSLTGAVLDLKNPERGPYDASWERIQQQGFFVVGTDPTLPPFSIHTDHGPIGLEPDIAHEIGKRLGLEVRFILLSYDGTYESLLRFPPVTDIVISTLRSDPFRMNVIHYTSPYFDAGHVLVSTKNYQMLEDVETVAVEFASEGDIVARRVQNLKIQRYFTAVEAMDAVFAGNADAALVDRVSAYEYVATHPEMGLASNTIVPDPYAIAIRRSDWRLYKAVEEALQDMKADGTLEALTLKWVQLPRTSP